MTTTTDVRKGLPSASGMERLVMCPGSFHAEQASPPSTDTPWSLEGTLIHSVLAGETPASELDDEQRWVMEKCLETERALVIKHGFENAYTEREVRLWYSDGERLLFSGQPDVVRIDDKRRALVVDWKTGRGELTPAERNYQMRALAVLIGVTYEADEVYVALVHPRLSDEPTVVRYSSEHLDRAEQEIREAIARSEMPDAPRVSGEHCKHCRALATCPETQRSVVDLAAEAFAWTKEALPTFNGEQLAELLPKVKLARRVCDAIEEKAKAYLEAGNEIPGWFLKPGVTRREITNLLQAYDKLSDVLSIPEFISACSVSIGKLETAVKSSVGCKAAEAKETVNLRLADLIVEKRNAPSLATTKNQIAMEVAA